MFRDRVRNGDRAWVRIRVKIRVRIRVRVRITVIMRSHAGLIIRH